MHQQNYEEIKKRNGNSAKAMGFLFAATIALVGWGFYSSSLPAFLLAGFFMMTLAAESRAYRESIKREKLIEKQKDLLTQLTQQSFKDHTDKIS
ncbi:hypothetical protein EEX84_02230 [Planococcus salinus]|uniref:Uncharacterized protein n=2 Tax=Planococcus salinus TaxID=1848460 RepID=A0A3M8PBU2_9BACL|nr:hypothetical protein EEX84_02230 [Planococcus salinus]